MIHVKDKRMAWILVEFDVSIGLPTEIDISWGASFAHRLDYCKVPFRCHLCHKTSHLRYTCPGFFESCEPSLPLLENVISGSEEEGVALIPDGPPFKLSSEDLLFSG